MITLTSKGDFHKTYNFLKKLSRKDLTTTLNKYGEIGVQALAAATPIDTGLTANSWGYEVKAGKNSATITWTNSNVNRGIPIVILIQYGHGTGTGGYVQPRDFINPAMKPVFDQIADDAWKEVTSE